MSDRPASVFSNNTLQEIMDFAIPALRESLTYSAISTARGCAAKIERWKRFDFVTQLQIALAIAGG